MYRIREELSEQVYIEVKVTALQNVSARRDVEPYAVTRRFSVFIFTMAVLIGTHAEQTGLPT